MTGGEILDWRNYQIEILRKPVKNLNLRVVPPGKIVMSIPLGCSHSTVINFLDAKRSWLEVNLAAVKAKYENFPDEGFDGSKLWYFGKCLKVIFKVDLQQAGKAKLYQDGVVFRCRRELTASEKQKAVQEFYEIALKKEVERLFKQWEPILGYYSSKVTIRTAKSRWGSCNVQTRAIMINRRLVYRPLECLEYVVVHELAHLHEASHGPRFKAFLDKYLKDWRKRKELLNNFYFNEEK